MGQTGTLNSSAYNKLDHPPDVLKGAVSFLLKVKVKENEVS